MDFCDAWWDGHLEAREEGQKVFGDFYSGFHYRDAGPLQQGESGLHRINSRNEMFARVYDGEEVELRSDEMVFWGQGLRKNLDALGIFVVKTYKDGNRIARFNDAIKDGLPFNPVFMYGLVNRNGIWANHSKLEK